ncbi:MAG: Rieske (2Fe-2S) protein [Sphingomonadales bacterium]|nr:Rieske (2Fe-2S) protein [Sphingomonadales bacterium]
MGISRITVPEVALGRSVAITVEGEQVLICRSATGLHAIRDSCPHQNLTMDGGRVRGNTIICPHHGARFSLEDGRSMSPITPKPITVLTCHEQGGELEINL